MNAVQNNKEKSFVNRQDFPGDKKTPCDPSLKTNFGPNNALGLKFESFVESIKIKKKKYPSCDEKAIRLANLLHITS
jgi:hypothetical protein